MKVVILAGGKGTRISEESRIKPKPMIEIGGRPIIWHIMKTYAKYGFDEFVICCGYKGQMIKKYFAHYYMYQTDCSFSLNPRDVEFSDSKVEAWKVTLADTGLETLTAGRLLRVKEYLHDEPFFLTYGDGVSDVDISKLLDFHQKNNRIATITTVQPLGRFGGAQINQESHLVECFKEKAREDQAWVNAGYMVMEPEIFDYLGDGTEMLEVGTFRRLVEDKQMNAYQHRGFWSPMDNIRDRDYLNQLWINGQAPWKVW